MSDFLRERRLERARSLLESGNFLSVSQVAMACGLVHLGRFSKQYRAHFGINPAHARARRAARAK